MVNCGEVAHPGEADSMVEALRRLLAGTRQYSYVGRENYTWEIIGQRYAALVSALSDGQRFGDECLGEKPPQ